MQLHNVPGKQSFPLSNSKQTSLEFWQHKHTAKCCARVEVWAGIEASICFGFRAGKAKSAIKTYFFQEASLFGSHLTSLFCLLVQGEGVLGQGSFSL